MYRRIVARIEQGNFTRAENQTSHFCAYFLPYDFRSKKVFLVHHRKAGLWLSPGGHLEPGETLFDTLNREVEEELGLERSYSGDEQPFMLSITEIVNPVREFMLSITEIVNPVRECRAHFDVWYLLKADGLEFRPDTREFLESKWVDFGEARELVIDQATLRALSVLESVRIPDAT